MNLLLWFFANYQQLYDAGEATVEFGEWFAAQVKKLFPAGSTPQGLTNAQLKEKLAVLAQEWPGALPVPEDIFDPILLKESEDPVAGQAQAEPDAAESDK